MPESKSYFTILTRTLSFALPVALLVVALDAGWVVVAQDDEIANARREAKDPCTKTEATRGVAKGLERRCVPDGSSAGVARGDFNGDGFADLAVGAPYEDYNIGIIFPDAGGVNIIYGSADGLRANADLTAPDDQHFDVRDFGYNLDGEDHFGWALAAGNFNGDDYSDLAIGVPDRDVLNTDDDAGIVVLIDGSPNGLDMDTARTLPLLTGAQGRAGAALVWGDFGGDGYGDLAVGIPNAAATVRGFFGSCDTTVGNAGKVQVFYGSSSSLTQSLAQTFNQDTTCGGGNDVGDGVEENDQFGSVLTAGDFNADDADDLVIGVPFENVDGVNDGMVHVITGTKFGRLGFAVRWTLTQDTPGMAGATETGDVFGRALATGDFDGDTCDDLAIGVPGEDLNSNTDDDAGAVHVVFGVPSETFPLDTQTSVFFSQGNLGQSVETDDFFGTALAVGNFNGDGREDLAIGSPREDAGSVRDAGMVSVVYGASNGLDFATAQHWLQGQQGIRDSTNPGDQFGYALSAWNYGKSSHGDLAIGAPFEDTGTNADSGVVHLIYGSATGLTATGNEQWFQDTPGIRDTAEAGDQFGRVLY